MYMVDHNYELTMLLKEGIQELKTDIREINLKLDSLQVQLLSTTVTKSSCSDCNKANADSHKSLTGWIIGIYSLLLTLVLALFSTK